jgi:hypothetical protein
MPVLMERLRVSTAAPLAAPSPGFAEAVSGSGLALALERRQQPAPSLVPLLLHQEEATSRASCLELSPQPSRRSSSGPTNCV